jgi:hypothetical protein
MKNDKKMIKDLEEFAELIGKKYVRSPKDLGWAVGAIVGHFWSEFYALGRFAGMTKSECEKEVRKISKGMLSKEFFLQAEKKFKKTKKSGG